MARGGLLYVSCHESRSALCQFQQPELQGSARESHWQDRVDESCHGSRSCHNGRDHRCPATVQTLKFKNSRTQELKNSRTQELKNSRTQECSGAKLGARQFALLEYLSPSKSYVLKENSESDRHLRPSRRR